MLESAKNVVKTNPININGITYEADLMWELSEVEWNALARRKREEFEAKRKGGDVA